MDSMRAKVYVAGPITKGDIEENVRKAIEAANELADLGFAPFVPHLNYYWDMHRPRPYEFWIALDNEYLPYCDAVLRLPGESKGADGEVLLANALMIPVFHDIESLDKRF